MKVMLKQRLWLIEKLTTGQLGGAVTGVVVTAIASGAAWVVLVLLRS